MTKKLNKPQFFGQVVFFEGIEQSPFRQRLARAALNLGGRAADYPIDLSETAFQLPWRECQSVLALASLAASAAFAWSASQEKTLEEWAK